MDKSLASQFNHVGSRHTSSMGPEGEESMKSLTKVEFTNLSKILYPKRGVTKSQIIEYYVKIAPKMLGFMKNRAVVTTRFPDGVDSEGFYEKDAPLGIPSWVDTFRRYSESSGRDVNYIVCNNLDTLLWLANLSALEIHVSFSKIEAWEAPDIVLFDLDPVPPAGFVEASKVSLLLKSKLEELGFTPYVKTTGREGLHVVLPIVAEYSYGQIREFVHQVGKYMAGTSKLVVSEVSQSKEAGKVYMDYPQNSSWKTLVCPYSLRAEKEATVSTPLSWTEIEEGIRPDTLNIFTVTKRADDPWGNLMAHRQRLEMK